MLLTVIKTLSKFFIKKGKLSLLFVIIILGLYCNRNDSSKTNTLKIALINDIQSFNPITSSDVFTVLI